MIIEKIKKMNIIDIVLLIIVVVLAIIALVLYSRGVLQPKQEEKRNIQRISVSNNSVLEVKVPQTQDEIIRDLSKKTERDRMEYYCGEYFKYLQKNEYEAAYNLLYADFKEIYFPTLDSYIEYVNKTYPQDCAFKYDDITRQGKIYVLDLVVLDILGSKDNEKKQRIVIKENTYNDFVLSFEVI